MFPKINRTFVFLILICSFSFVSCSQEIKQSNNSKNIKTCSEQKNNQFEQFRFAVIGSSTAEGAKASCKDSSWVGRLDNYLIELDTLNELLNLAKSGYTTFHLLPDTVVRIQNRPFSDTLRNVDFVLKYNPTHVVINLPSNDAAYGYTVEEQINNFHIMFASFQNKGIKVFICSAQPRNFKDKIKIQAQFELNIKLKSLYNVEYVDFWTEIANIDGTIKEHLNSGDGIHLNDEGHRILFNNLLKSLDLMN